MAHSGISALCGTAEPFLDFVEVTDILCMFVKLSLRILMHVHAYRYSYNFANTHFSVISTEHDCNPGSDQYR